MRSNLESLILDCLWAYPTAQQLGTLELIFGSKVKHANLSDDIVNFAFENFLIGNNKLHNLKYQTVILSYMHRHGIRLRDVNWLKIRKYGVDYIPGPRL